MITQTIPWTCKVYDVNLPKGERLIHTDTLTGTANYVGMVNIEVERIIKTKARIESPILGKTIVIR